MPLWTSDEIAQATGGVASADFAVAGITFDSREVEPGDLFLALGGEHADGHRFVDQAFARGAAGVVVAAPVAGPHVLVTDTGVALDALGRAGRARAEAHSNARIIGVTGSVGKTGVKEALFACLDRATSGRVHRSVKSYNNHVGVPLSLARMPADTCCGVFEMGMNHTGELAALTRMVRPHVALITAIAPAHLEHFADEGAIADAKAEIFAGLEPGGIAIVPTDTPHATRIAAAAARHAARVLRFGAAEDADVRALEIAPGAAGTFIIAKVGARELSFTLAPPGAHWVSNALCVLAAVDAVGGDLAQAGLALAELDGLAGRGARLRVPVGDGEALLIDESYNANPASMCATLAVLGSERATRRVAVLGEMKELGDHAPALHAALAEPVLAAGVAVAILVGEPMAALAEALEGQMRIVHVADAAAARDRLRTLLAPGDAVLVKGSNGVGLAAVVRALASGEA